MQNNEHARLIETFYTCFQQKDHAGMIVCYHPLVEFSDLVFTHLTGKRAGAMWHMLCERGKDMTLQFSGIEAAGDTGKAHWEANYTFSGSKRPVHNIIDAAFEFRDDKIIRHRDHFDFWRWSRMALGTSGLLLGWTPFLQKKVRDSAQIGLDAFIARHPEYQ